MWSSAERATRSAPAALGPDARPAGAGGPPDAGDRAGNGGRAGDGDRAGRSGRARVVGSAVALGLLLSTLFGVAVATAHATLLSTSPADGATLSVAPAQIRMVFSEEIAVGLGSVGLTDDAGRGVPGVAIEADPAHPEALIVTLPALKPGAYSLNWRMVDEVDLHVTSGTVVFGLGVAAPRPVGRPDPVPGPGEVVIRWLDLLATSLAGGALFLLAVVVPRRSPVVGDGPFGATDGAAVEGLRRRLLRLALAGAAAGLATGAGLLAIGTSGAGGSLAGVFSTAYGVSWALREAALAGLVAVLAVACLRHVDARRSGDRPDGAGSPGRATLALCLSLVGAVAVAGALGGHAETGPAGERILRTGALAVHILAVMGWFGGLLAVAAGVLPALWRSPAERAVVRPVLRRFWIVAAPSLAALAVTGLFLAGQLVQSLDALALTLYGQTLLAKSVLVGAGALLGLRNSAELHRSASRLLGRLSAGRLGSGRTAGTDGPALGRWVGLEAATGVAIVLAASVMSASPPARGPAFDPLPAVVVQPPLAFAASDLEVVMSLRPNRPGPNFVELAVYDTRRPAPAPIGEVRTRLIAPGGSAGEWLTARPLGQSRYEVSDRSIDAAGGWGISVSVTRPGLPDAEALVRWEVPPAPLGVARRTLVSSAPLGPAATALAVLLALTLGALLLGVAARQYLPRLRASNRSDAPAAVAGQGGKP